MRAIYVKYTCIFIIHGCPSNLTNFLSILNFYIFSTAVGWHVTMQQIKAFYTFNSCVFVRYTPSNLSLNYPAVKCKNEQNPNTITELTIRLALTHGYTKE